jgi:hypothetical protein
MHRVSDHAAPDGRSRIARPPMLPSARFDSVGALDSVFEAQYLACAYPCQRFAAALTNDSA